jgi:hypothetical protein
MSSKNFRSVGFAVVTLAGALHLSTAEAAVPVTMDACADYAAGYAAGYCAAQGKEVKGYGYECDDRGTALQIVVLCQ